MHLKLENFQNCPHWNCRQGERDRKKERKKERSEMARRRIFNISDTINCFKPFKCQAALFKLEIVSVSTFVVVVGCLHEFAFVRFFSFSIYMLLLANLTLTHSLERTLFISIFWRAHCFILRFSSGYGVCVFFSLALLLLMSDFQWSLPTINFSTAILLLSLQQQPPMRSAHNYLKRH